MAAAVPRLKRRSEFLRVAATGRKWVTPGLILQIRNCDDGETPVRAGFTVSRKVGNAVERNRAKRRLRAAAWEVLADFARRGNELVIIGRRKTLNRPFPALIKDLKTALRRLDAYRNGTQ
jgi:ribonuclease P protein component